MKQQPNKQQQVIEELPVTHDQAEVVKGGVNTVGIKTFLCPSDPRPA